MPQNNDLNNREENISVPVDAQEANKEQLNEGRLKGGLFPVWRKRPLCRKQAQPNRESL